MGVIVPLVYFVYFQISKATRAAVCNCALCRFLCSKEWAELPDALPTKTAASLIGCQPQRIYELIKENVLHGIKIGAVQYIPKSEFISYAALPEKLSKPTSDAYRELIQEFKKRQCRKRENAKRRVKRCREN